MMGGERFDPDLYQRALDLALEAGKAKAAEQERFAALFRPPPREVDAVWIAPAGTPPPGGAR